jgi:hypothetical protein
MQLLRSAFAALLAGLFAAPVFPRGPFEGTWQNCEWLPGEKKFEVCSIAVIHQKSARVCGFWHYWATNREYEGRFIATVDGNRLNWGSVCGRPGSRATSDCPVSPEHDALTLKLGGEPQWGPTTGRTLLCKGMLFEFEAQEGPQNCQQALANRYAYPLVKRSPNSRKYAPGKRPEDLQWLKVCLSE